MKGVPWLQDHLEFENLLHKLEKGIITLEELDKLGEHIFEVETILQDDSISHELKEKIQALKE